MAMLSEFLKSGHPLSLHSFVTDKTTEFPLYGHEQNIPHPDLMCMRRPRIQAVVPMEDIAVRGHTEGFGKLMVGNDVQGKEVEKSIPDSVPRVPEITAYDQDTPNGSNVPVGEAVGLLGF